MKAEGKGQKAEDRRRTAKSGAFSPVPLRSILSVEFGFTLVELVLVMAVLVVLLAIVAPVLSASMRGRVLVEQGTRLQALTEYSRDEAASQGVPVVVWVNPETRRFGADAKMGYIDLMLHAKEYTLPADFSFDPVAGVQASKTEGHGFDVAEFEPDGSLDPASVASVRIANRQRTSGVSITQTPDGYGYEIVKEAGR